MGGGTGVITLPHRAALSEVNRLLEGYAKGPLCTSLYLCVPQSASAHLHTCTSDPASANSPHCLRAHYSQALCGALQEEAAGRLFTDAGRGLTDLLLPSSLALDLLPLPSPPPLMKQPAEPPSEANTLGANSGPPGAHGQGLIGRSSMIWGVYRRLRTSPFDSSTMHPRDPRSGEGGEVCRVGGGAASLQHEQPPLVPLPLVPPPPPSPPLRTLLAHELRCRRCGGESTLQVGGGLGRRRRHSKEGKGGRGGGADEALAGGATGRCHTLFIPQSRVTIYPPGGCRWSPAGRCRWRCPC